jgi:hypothetical protein
MCFAGAALTIAHHRVREYVYGNICNERWGQYILPAASRKSINNGARVNVGMQCRQVDRIKRLAICFQRCTKVQFALVAGIGTMQVWLIQKILM